MEPVTIEEQLWDFDAGEAFDVKAEVGPMLRDGDYAILPVVVNTDSELNISFRNNIFNDGYVEEDAGHDIRLIDVEEMTVSHMAVLQYDQDWDDGISRQALETFLGEGSLNNRTRMGAGHEPTRYFAAFRTPKSENVHILFQNLGVAENVPVIDLDDSDSLSLSEAESSEESNEDKHPLGVPSIKEIVERELTTDAFERIEETYLEQIVTREMPLESYRESVETSVSRIDEIEHSTLVLSSDVLFEFDSADLTDDADEELESAISELEGVEGGELVIVGHTDNEGTEEYNQELSEDRADSVQLQLQELTDLEVFEGITVRGESFREPIADNDTEGGRAQNRRVEIHFTPPTEQVVLPEESELPESFGEVAEYPDSAAVKGGEVEVVSLTKVDNLLVGRLRVQANGDELSFEALSTYGSGATASAGARGWSTRDVLGHSGSTVYNLTILHGDQRYFPLDYYLTPLPGTTGEQQLEDEEDMEFIVPLAERFLPSSSTTSTPEEGAYYMATVIWPAVDTGEVALELALPSIATTPRGDLEDEISSVQPWRVTDIPIESSEND